MFLWISETPILNPGHKKVPEAPAVHIDDVYITGILR